MTRQVATDLVLINPLIILIIILFYFYIFNIIKLIDIPLQKNSYFTLKKFTLQFTFEVECELLREFWNELSFVENWV